MVNKLREKVDEIFVSDLEHFTPGSTYDVVLCAGVLDFVLDPQIAFKNLATLIAPSGRLIVHAPRVGVAGWIYRLEKRLLHIEVNLFSLGWFETEAKKHGLTVVGYANPLPTNRVVSFERLPATTT
jgi:2-polyprenyl-3-methyl-5-hydroxy-6-metoxy-1,4-benzoquinol methylase